MTWHGLHVCRFAVKTISKIPKRGLPTPRYLLKLRTEVVVGFSWSGHRVGNPKTLNPSTLHQVEIMQQLGYSLDAVNLKDVFEDDENVHVVMELCEGGALFERIDRSRYTSTLSPSASDASLMLLLTLLQVHGGLHCFHCAHRPALYLAGELWGRGEG